MKIITVLLSDDHDVVREGLRSLLATAEDIQVVGEAENGHQSVREAKRLLPDVVLLDLAMPLLNGVEATRQIVKQVPATKVLILSAYSDAPHVQQALKAGAAGYLMKEAAADDLLHAIRQVARGKAFFSPPVATRFLTSFRGMSPHRCLATTLTSRQTEVVQLVAEGYPTKQIADVLSLSIKTVEKHRGALMTKLNMHNVAMITRYAVDSGIVESNRARPLFPRSARLTHAGHGKHCVNQVMANE